MVNSETTRQHKAAGRISTGGFVLQSIYRLKKSGIHSGMSGEDALNSPILILLYDSANLLIQ